MHADVPMPPRHGCRKTNEWLRRDKGMVMVVDKGMRWQVGTALAKRRSASAIADS